jgi:hypothetical protein
MAGGDHKFYNLFSLGLTQFKSVRKHSISGPPVVPSPIIGCKKQHHSHVAVLIFFELPADEYELRRRFCKFFSSGKPGRAIHFDAVALIWEISIVVFTTIAITTGINIRAL